MGRRSYGAWLALVVGAAVACGNSAPPAALTCMGGFQASFSTGPVSESVNMQCGGQLNGSVQAGGACQSDLDCAPTCCACPNGTNSASVAWCQGGVCAGPNDACCAFQYVQTTDVGDGGSHVCGQ